MKPFFLLFFGFLISSSSLHAQKVYQKNLDNEKLISEGWMEDGKKEGYWKFYYPNGEIKKKGYFANGEKTEYWYVYSILGNLTEEGHYKNGLRTHWWKFYQKGKIVRESQYNRGILHGYTVLKSLGKIYKVEKFNLGKKIGDWTELKAFRKDNPVVFTKEFWD